MRGSTLRRFAASSRLWIDDDSDPHGRAGMAGDWPHRHAVLLSEPGSPRAGGAQAQPHGRWSFLLQGKTRDLLKVIWHDGQGACLFTKRLERGRFIWPSVAGEAVTISPAQLSYLLSGIDWRNPQETWRPTRAG